MDLSHPDAVTIAVRLPSGRTPRRSFYVHDNTVSDLYAFATFQVPFLQGCP